MSEDEEIADPGSGKRRNPKKAPRRAFAATILFGLLTGVLAIIVWPGHSSVNPVLRFVVGLIAGNAIVAVLIPFVGFFEYRGLMKGARKRRRD